jgi:hypothetical protein
VVLLNEGIQEFVQKLQAIDLLEVHLLDPTRGRLRRILTAGVEGEGALNRVDIDVREKSLISSVVRTGRATITPDAAADDRASRSEFQYPSWLVVPLGLSGSVIGTLSFACRKREAFTEKDMPVMEMFSRDVAGAMQRMGAVEQKKAGTAVEPAKSVPRSLVAALATIRADASTLLQEFGGERRAHARLLQLLGHIDAMDQSIQTQREIPEGEMNLSSPPESDRPTLRGKRVLLVSEHEEFLTSAQQSLHRHVTADLMQGSSRTGEFVHRGLSRKYDVVVFDDDLSSVESQGVAVQLCKSFEPERMVLLSQSLPNTAIAAQSARLNVGLIILRKPLGQDQLLDALESAFKAER